MSGKTIRFTLDGREVEAKEGETIWQVAKREGTSIPHLCWRDEPGYRADGNCRACMVEVEGERVLAASCIRQPAEGMVVNSQNERASTARKMVIELLMADQPDREDAHDQQSSFFKWADSMQVDVSRFPRDDAPKPDVSHPAMAVNLDACIHCNLCVRACREVQVNDVIGMAFRGPHEKIVFDFDDPMGASTCVACGECVQACPTGALMPKSIVDENQRGSRGAEREVDSVCPYCGVGCQITYNIRTDEKTGNEYIAYVEGKGGPANENRLCVKGRFGFDYVASPERLTKPLIRKPGLEKGINMDPLNPLSHFREASWEEALEFASKGLRDIRDAHGGNALAGFGSAKCSNEEAYIFQKLVRTGFGTNNVDHCTRLCHASSVAALMETIGSGAVTAPFTAVKDSDVIVVIGANPTENHPVAATYFKQAAKRGAELIIMDPRGTAMKRYASHMLQFKNGADVSLLNAMMHVIVEEKLYDQQYIQAHSEGFDKLKEHLKKFKPEDMEKDLRHLCRRDPHRCPQVCHGQCCNHLLGHGRVAAHPRHRQCPLPDLSGADVRPDGACGNRPASAAWPEQRARRVRCRPDPHGVPGLFEGGRSEKPRKVREALGRQA
jgi:formate dehydrogenase major subunit